MTSKINHIGSKVSRAVGKGLKTLSRGNAALAAAVAALGLGLSGSAMGAVADVQSIQTTLLLGAPSPTVNTVPGAGGNSGYTSAHNYHLHYAGEDLEITKITTATKSYVPTATATAVVDRHTGPNTDTIWYQGSGTNTSANLNFAAAIQNGIPQAFGGNNLLTGADNLFSNSGNAQNNNTNIERLDMLYSGGFKTNISKIFAIFERGLTNQHDAFKIAAITSLDGSGNPSGYGTLISLGSGAWGKTDDVSPEQYLVTRKNDSIAGDHQHPSDSVVQPIGGVVIPTTDLAPAGTTIFGYSLFAGDVSASGAGLVNYAAFPTGTTEFTGGGIDLVGTASVLYTDAAAIPEPTTGTLALCAIGGLLARRSKRQRV